MKIGDTVKVVFTDHTEGSGEDGSLLNFVVFGRLVKKTKLMLSVQPWCYADESAVPDENCNQYNISRRSVISTAVLTEGTV